MTKVTITDDFGNTLEMEGKAVFASIMGPADREGVKVCSITMGQGSPAEITNAAVRGATGVISEIMKKLPGVQAAELGIAASKAFADALFDDDKNVVVERSEIDPANKEEKK